MKLIPRQKKSPAKEDTPIQSVQSATDNSVCFNIDGRVYVDLEDASFLFVNSLCSLSTLFLLMYPL